MAGQFSKHKTTQNILLHIEIGGICKISKFAYLCARKEFKAEACKCTVGLPSNCN